MNFKTNGFYNSGHCTLALQEKLWGMGDYDAKESGFYKKSLFKKNKLFSTLIEKCTKNLNPSFFNM